MKKNNPGLDALLLKPTLPGEVFVEETKLSEYKDDLPPEKYPKSWTTVYFKAYERFPSIKLPKPQLSPKPSYKNVLTKRESFRNYGNKPLTLQQISSLLYYSMGNKNTKKHFNADRFYPSGGSRYPLETYFLAINTQLQPGLYHYYVKNHELECLLELPKFKITDYFIQQKWLHKVGGFVLLTSVFHRTTMKYRQKGYRFSFIEAGHAGQNIYLTSTALNIGCCGVGGILDKKLEKLLDIDGFNEAIMYALAVGNKGR